MRRSKDEVRDRLIGKLDAIIDDPEMSVKDILKAIELVGKEYGLFIETKNVKIDVNTVVRQFTDQQLRTLAGNSNEMVDAGGIIDLQPGISVLTSVDDAEGRGGVEAVGSEDGVAMDQGLADADRKETRRCRCRPKKVKNSSDSSKVTRGSKKISIAQ